jgi:hypothetical protein
VIHRLVSEHPKRAAEKLDESGFGTEAVARMARFGVRPGSLPYARSHGKPCNTRFDRTSANGSERLLALAMQKVEG